VGEEEKKKKGAASLSAISLEGERWWPQSPRFPPFAGGGGRGSAAAVPLFSCYENRGEVRPLSSKGESFARVFFPAGKESTSSSRFSRQGGRERVDRSITETVRTRGTGGSKQ